MRGFDALILLTVILSHFSPAQAQAPPTGFDLTLLKTAETSVQFPIVREGEEFTYRLDYRNLGDADATGVIITEPVPRLATFNSAGPDAGLWNCSGTSPGDTCTHDVGTLAPGQSGSVRFPVTAATFPTFIDDAGCRRQDFPEDLIMVNTATIAGGDGQDANPGDNSDSAEVGFVVDVVQCLPILIEKMPPSQTIPAGEAARFTITVTNTSLLDYVDLRVNDSLTPNCEREIGALPVGESVAYDCQANNVLDGFTNEAVVRGESVRGAPVSFDDRAEVVVTEAPLSHRIPTLLHPLLILLAGGLLALGGQRLRRREPAGRN